MKLNFLLFFFLIFLHQNLSAQNSGLDLRIFSSENGYALVPDNVSVVRFEDGKDYSQSLASLQAGSYAVSVSKSGYSNCESYFSTEGKDIRIDVYLDPAEKNPLFGAERVKGITKSNSTLFLGYVTDEDGRPLENVSVKNSEGRIVCCTNSEGYYELYLPARRESRTFVNLTFEKSGSGKKEYRGFELCANTDFILNVRLSKFNRNKESPESGCAECNSKPNDILPYTGFVLPLNIRVGRNCTGTNCTYAEVYSLETYCKYVLPAEVYSCWGNINGGMNSLQACAAAVRSYGVYYVYNPINPSLYDICDNTYCQYFGSAQSTNTNLAVDNTYRSILTDASGVVRNEYSAENNNRGCGNGYSGTGSTWPCIYDPVCLNASPNGHGRGLCQWGSVRWATGTLVSLGSPCSPGTPHSYGTLSWQQILNHYYNVPPYNWSVTQGTTATINSSTCQPSASAQCSTITIGNSVTATNTVSLILGASVASAGTTNWISDPAHDVKPTFSQGTGNYDRLFTIPCTAQPGVYDLLTAVWYDKNNNNQVDLGDFVVHSRLTPNALTVSPTGIQELGSEIPKEFSLAQNYPNPFNPSTNIRFDLPKFSFVRVVIYDVLGRAVTTLVEQELKPGRYSVGWSGGEYPSGAYYCKLTADGYMQTRKMVLIR